MTKITNNLSFQFIVESADFPLASFLHETTFTLLLHYFLQNFLHYVKIKIFIEKMYVPKKFDSKVVSRILYLALPLDTPC